MPVAQVGGLSQKVHPEVSVAAMDHVTGVHESALQFMVLQHRNQSKNFCKKISQCASAAVTCAGILLLGPKMN